MIAVKKIHRRDDHRKTEYDLFRTIHGVDDRRESCHRLVYTLQKRFTPPMIAMKTIWGRYNRSETEYDLFEMIHSADDRPEIDPPAR